jgi:alkylation response protein AidB-like acyl-CoA dehydrogenase
LDARRISKEDGVSRLFSDHFCQELDEHERGRVEQVRTLCRETIGPQAEEVGRQDVFARATFELLANAGIVGTAFPRQFGGTDARQLLRIRLIEELGRVCTAAASLITGTDLSTRAIIAGATPTLQEELLPQLCRGTLQAAFALTEPGAGSDVNGLSTTAVADGDGYRLSGRKKFITRANTADWFVVIARCERAGAGAAVQARGARPMVALLVPRDAPGLMVGPVVEKLGWYGVPICNLSLDGVVVPQHLRLGQEGEGFALAQDALVRARLGHASMALGRAIGAVEIAATYCCDRSLFGKTLGNHQGAQWIVADMATQIEAARALLAAAAASYDRGDENAPMLASMAKMHATDLGMKVVTDALQLTGGRGYLKAFPLERFFRDAKLNQIGEGSSEVHRTVVGRHFMRRAGAPGTERHPCLPEGRLTTDW